MGSPGPSMALVMVRLIETGLKVNKYGVNREQTTVTVVEA